MSEEELPGGAVAGNLFASEGLAYSGSLGASRVDSSQPAGGSACHSATTAAAATLAATTTTVHLRTEEYHH